MVLTSSSASLLLTRLYFVSHAFAFRLKSVSGSVEALDVSKRCTGPRPFLNHFTDQLAPFQPEEGRSREPPPWDEYFHAIAQAVALRSKDKSRIVGAVIVSKDNVILSTGYNGFPRGIREIAERTDCKREKLRWVTHAETNAIFNASRSGVSLVDSTIYVTTFPCSVCAQAIVQAGIKKVFTYGEYWVNDPNGYDKAIEMFAEGDVQHNAPRMMAMEKKLRAKKQREENKKKIARERAAHSAMRAEFEELRAAQQHLLEILLQQTEQLGSLASSRPGNTNSSDAGATPKKRRAKAASFR